MFVAEEVIDMPTIMATNCADTCYGKITIDPRAAGFHYLRQSALRAGIRCGKLASVKTAGK